MTSRQTINVTVKPATEKTIRNYYGVKELPTNPDTPDWDAQDEAGWDWDLPSAPDPQKIGDLEIEGWE